MPADLNSAFDRLEQLLEFPCRYPIKIMGERHERFAGAVAALVRRHAPDFDPETVRETVSRKGTFVSVTVVIEARSREQLQTLYEALADHEWVRIVL